MVSKYQLAKDADQILWVFDEFDTYMLHLRTLAPQRSFPLKYYILWHLGKQFVIFMFLEMAQCV